MNSVAFTNVETLGHNHIKFPMWLDNLIYKETKAPHQPCGKDMIVLNWDKARIINYLGTYFPRSFAESYCIFTKYFELKKELYKETSTLNIFDFGCGTGGELLGLLWAIMENIEVANINIKALDGNFNGLRILEDIITRFKDEHHVGVNLHVMPLKIDDIYDMSLVSSRIPDDNDIILIFKSICEMASLRQFEERNPYEHVLRLMLEKINSTGVICLADVSSFNEEQQEWLPKLIDKACQKVKANVFMRNDNYNELYIVSHSRKMKDSSKLSWRLLTGNKI